MIINTHTHTIKHVINNNVSNQLTNSNREQQTSRLATLLFLCSMMVDEHITIYIFNYIVNKNERGRTSRQNCKNRNIFANISLHIVTHNTPTIA